MNRKPPKFKTQNLPASNKSHKKLFDTLVELSDQAEWENNLEFQDLGGPRIEDAELRDKYHLRYQQFLQMPEAADVLAILNEYITKCIPFPVKTEMNYWGSSCMPSGGNKNYRVLARINMNWLEVLSLYLHNGRIFFSFHVARSPLEEILHGQDATTNSFNSPDFYEITTTGHMYVPGGFDQLNLEGYGADNALTLLGNKDFLQAARLFNLRLMKRGRTPYSNSHCFDLADNFLKQPPQVIQVQRT